MKKKLKSDLVQLAHQILKIDADTDYTALKLQVQKVYEALTVLAYIETHFDEDTTSPDAESQTAKSSQQEAAFTEEEVTENLQLAADETATGSQKETDLERIARILEANEELLEQLRKQQAQAQRGAAVSMPQKKTEEKINQASLHEPVIEKIKDIVAQMPPEADAIEHMFQQITGESKNLKNDRLDIGEYGREASFEEPEKPKEEKLRTLNDRVSRGLSFGLNDRIAFIKHLFNGSTSDFNRVLSQLNTAHSQEEAFNLIDQMIKPDYNDWEGKEVYEARFKELVARKFD